MVYLSRMYTYDGNIYGPGETDVPQNVRDAKDLTSAFRAELEGEAPANDPFQPDTSNDPTLQPDDNENLEGFAGLSSDVVIDLNAAGYRTKDDLRAASDEDLDAVPGVGQGRISAIREALADEEGR